jgi:hypothetical protein
MQWFQRHAWWGLLAIAALTAVRGLVDLATGVTWQAEDVTGSTSAEIAAQSSAGSKLIDFVVRTQGLCLIAIGVLLCAVLLFAYRLDRPWVWWAMWTLPVFVIANSLLMLAFGAWGPAITGTVVGLVAALPAGLWRRHPVMTGRSRAPERGRPDHAGPGRSGRTRDRRP